MLAFTNLTQVEINVAIMWYTPNCPDGGDWSKAGWYILAPGQNKQVFDGDLHDINRNWLFFAEDLEGRIWAGPFVRAVPPTAFDWCEWTASTASRDVGFRLQDIGDNDDVTINIRRSGGD